MYRGCSFCETRTKKQFGINTNQHSLVAAADFTATTSNWHVSATDVFTLHRNETSETPVSSPYCLHAATTHNILLP